MTRRQLLVLGTRELRDQMSEILREIREKGAKAKPVIGGANRRPELIILPYEAYMELMDELDNLAIADELKERLPHAFTRPTTSLEDTARELGFDPDVIFAEGASSEP